jgi:putative tryptophan/tyrosine transport system substrate-binding protein
VRTGSQWLVILFILVSVHVAEAQHSTRIPRIGYISATGDAKNPGPLADAFRQGLQEFGLYDGKNIVVDYRYVAGQPERSPALVAELVQLNIDVLVAAPIRAILAAKEATKTIPIVMVTSQDPVAIGLVDSLARPGGNLTGITSLARELSGKRLEIVKELVPEMRRVGLLGDRSLPGSVLGFKEYEAAARALKVEFQYLEARGPKELEGAFQGQFKGGTSAAIVISNPVFLRHSKRIAELALKNRVPSMYERSDYVEAGGLMSYAANDSENYRRAAAYVDKILKGVRPAELPIEQPTKFELVINLKTAKQIGLTIPPNVLARADRVIK